MFLSSTLSGYLGIADAAVIALLGYAVVFFGLILLMVVITIMGRCFIAMEKKSQAKDHEALSRIHNPAPTAPAASADSVTAQPAPGTAGNLKLYDTPPKTAAMIMAIVADKMGKPLNELRFKSIREVK